MEVRRGKRDTGIQNRVTGSLKYGGKLPASLFIADCAVEAVVLAVIGLLLYIAIENPRDPGTIACFAALAFCAVGAGLIGKSIITEIRARLYIRRYLQRDDCRTGKAVARVYDGGAILSRTRVSLEIALPSGVLVRVSSRGSPYFARLCERRELDVLYSPSMDDVLILK